jgi:hypothetical protein
VKNPGGPPFNHPNDEDLSLHPSEQKSLAGDPESLGTPMNHPNDEDLSLHPSEQKSLAGDPESLGPRCRQKQSERMGHGA